MGRSRRVSPTKLECSVPFFFIPPASSLTERRYKPFKIQNLLLLMHHPKLHPNELPMMLRLAGLWLIYVSWCQTAGWVLSGLHSLHTTGYLAASPVALGLALWFWTATRPATAKRVSFSKWLRRTKASPSLMAWCGVTLLILIGALINPPSNYDGLTYRLPKLLYWLQEKHWHWIDGLDFRLNITGAGFEWLSAPFILFTRSDRWLFLLNFLPFLLLPGLFFVAARGLGIRLRTARWWMWVWPMAYGIAMQAGSIGNDMVAAALALASLAFAAHALRARPCLCLFLSALAAAAMTGIKATTLPLGLPLGIYWLWVGATTVGWRRILPLVIGVSPLAILLSFLPIALACSVHTGKWNGNPNDRHGFEPKNPIAGLIGNSIEFTMGLITPPVLPGAHAISKKMVAPLEKTSWYQWVKTNYTCLNPSLNPEMPSEESAGIGMGITLLCVTVAVYTLIHRRNPKVKIHLIQWVLVSSIGFALFLFMCKSGVGGTKRLTVPFIPFLILGYLIAIRPAALLASRGTNFLSLFPSICLLPALFLNPNRPILPITWVTDLPGFPPSIQVRTDLVYLSYAIRSDLLAPFRARIPQGETVAFAGNDHPSTALFKPYGGNSRVTDLIPGNTEAIQWIVGTPESIELRVGMSLAEWEAKSGFTKVYEEALVSRATTGPDQWLLYRKTQPR